MMSHGDRKLRRVRVIPTLLLDRESRLVKTVKFGKRTYIGDPINAVRIYNRKEVDELILFDIDASRDGRSPNIRLIRDIVSEAFIPVAYGGGIRTLKDIESLYDCGIEKVVLSSALANNDGMIEATALRWGSQAVVACLPVKKSLLGKQTVRFQSGRNDTGLDPIAFAQQLRDRGVGEIIVYAINRDGTYSGYDLDLTAKVAAAVDIPVVACGGASEIKDFCEAITKAGCSAVAAGSVFVYQARDRGVLITYPSQDRLVAELFEKIHL